MNIRQMKFQVCATVSKALGSVMRIAKHGNKVVFGDDCGSYIEDKTTKKRMWMEGKDGVYTLPCVVAPAAEAKKRLEKDAEGCQRQAP